ncbi:MAG TPA: DUF692 domain-containing protein [Vicinamibacteria bacterium]|nr:DUF692 domain-containing protein [Vicinamibacteria bacterium]
MSRNRWDHPDLGLGVGLRTAHFAHILSQRPELGFFEVLTENFLDTGGRPLFVLDQIAERYPIVMHGVSLSIGSTDPLDFDYLRKVKDLARRTKAAWVSDHVCWTGVLGRNTHDLLPLPYTEAALRHTAERVKAVQEFLERPVVLENPSTYLEFTPSAMSEWEFIGRLAEEADCGLLLDVNNVYVSAFNHGYDAHEYIDAIPVDRVCQYHLAGHTHKGTHILDTHSDHVVQEVWELFGHAVQRTGPRATLLEWDASIPPFEVVHAEVLKAAAWREREVSRAA